MNGYLSMLQPDDDEYAACPCCGDPLPDHVPNQCRPYMQALKKDNDRYRAVLVTIAFQGLSICSELARKALEKKA